MGSEFSIVYDVIVIAVIGGMAFAGWKKGFVNVVINLISMVVAFALGIGLSAPIANSIYKNFIEKSLKEQISAVIDSQFDAVGLDEFRLSGLGEIDADKITISGIPISEYQVDYKGGTMAVLDLSKLDLSQAGISAEDLENLGLDPNEDLTEFNAKTAEFSKSDIEKYGLGKLVTAQFAAVNIAQTELFKNFNSIADVVAKFIPSFSTKGSTENVTISGLRTASLLMMDTGKNVVNAIIDEVVAPNCIVFIRTILFVLIFILVQVILGIIANVTKSINKIPLIGKANSVLGLISGLCEGAVVVIIICIVTKFFVVISNDSAIMLNSSTIDQTFLFKHIYEMIFISYT